MAKPINPTELLADLRRIEHSVVDLLVTAETEGNRKIASKLRKHLMEVQQMIVRLSS